MYPLLCVLLFALDDDFSQLPDMQHLRIAIVDVSSSMAGDRLQTVQSELLQLFDRFPPSPEHPLVLIPFASSPFPPRVFTTLKDAQNTVRSLNASGGTRIAGGLREAHRVLEQLAAVPQALILLYSDGEDGDQDAIRHEEEKFSKLFALRSDQGLGNHVVLKRWGGANARLEESFRRMQGVLLTDAEDLAIKPISFDPQLRVLNTKRPQDNPSCLDVEIEATLNAPTGIDLSTFPPISFSCSNPNVQGNTAFELRPGQTKRISLKLPLRGDGLDPPAIDVPFRVNYQPQPALHDKDSLLVPIMPDTSLVASVPVPDLNVSSVITATLENDGKLQWLDPLEGTIAVHVLVTISRRDLDRGANRYAVAVTVKPKQGRILQGDTNSTFDEPGVQKFPLVFGLSPAPQASADPPLYDLAFSIELRSLSPLLIIQEPRELNFDRRDIQAPPPLEVPVRCTAEVLPAGWLRLPDLSYVTCRVLAHADGPIPPGSAITFTAPPEISRIAVDTQTFDRNDQAVRLALAAGLAPHPQSTSLTIPFVLQSSRPYQITLVPSSPLAIQVTGPAPVNLTNAAASRRSYHRKILDSTKDIRIPVQPVIRDIHDQRCVPSLPVSVLAGDDRLATIPLNELQQVTLPLPQEKQSFFRNRKIKIAVKLAPATPTPAIRPAVSRVDVFQLAPVLRYLLYASLGLTPVLVLVLLVAVIRRFHSSADLNFTKTEESRAVAVRPPQMHPHVQVNSL